MMGVYLCQKIFYKLSKDEILKFSKLSFQEISEFIFSKYTGETFKKTN